MPEKSGLFKIFRKSTGESDYERVFLNISEDDLKDPKKRKSLLEKIPLEYIVKYGVKLLPKEIKDDFVDEKLRKKLKNGQKNTGVYLWAHGYTPVECLGTGCNGVVWRCEGDIPGKNIAVKVACDGRKFGFIPVKATKEEIQSAEFIKRIVGENAEVASKYLVYSTHDRTLDKKTGKKRAVMRSELSDKGDLEHYKSSKNGYNHFIEILNTGINVLNGLKILHDAGYSHNDVKPDNLLVITTQSNKVADQLATDSENTKDSESEVVVKLADFGAMTKIDSKLHQKIFVNRNFSPPDVKNICKEAVAKRDVYALGVTLVYLLLRCAVTKARKMSKKLEKSKDVTSFCKMEDGSNLLTKYGCDININRAKQFDAFLETVKNMVSSNYEHRLTVDEALQELKIVRNMSC